MKAMDIFVILPNVGVDRPGSLKLERPSGEFGENGHMPQRHQRVVNEGNWPPSALEDLAEEIAHHRRRLEKLLDSFEFGVGRLEDN